MSFSDAVHLSFFETGSLVNLGLTNSARLTSQGAPGTLLLPFLQHWGYRRVMLGLVF